MAKSISIAIIVALTIANLLPAAECTASRGNGADDLDNFDDRVSKSGVSAIKRPFFVGSRYGRSEFGKQKQLNIAPRNDRFFLQSRYGKRSQELLTNNFSDQLDRDHSGEDEQEDVPLICLFTGVADLYRCKNYGPAHSVSSSSSSNNVDLPRTDA